VCLKERTLVDHVGHERHYTPAVHEVHPVRDGKLIAWDAYADFSILPLEAIDYAWPGMASRPAFPERLIAPLG
jgi:hypothetical protein